MIRRLERKMPVYLCTQVTDMRKSINGLAAIVQGSFELDPYCGALFVFCNRQRDKIKVLQWDKDGFVLYYKRREKGRFQWPTEMDPEEKRVNITKNDLDRLLAGLIMEKFVPHRLGLQY